jgi:hypothetical protein
MATNRFDMKQFIIDFPLKEGLKWLQKLRQKP